MVAKHGQNPDSFWLSSKLGWFFVSLCASKRPKVGCLANFGGDILKFEYCREGQNKYGPKLCVPEIFVIVTYSFLGTVPL